MSRLGLLFGLTLVYVIAGKLGLRLAFVQSNATAVWAPAGIALAAFLGFGVDVWPAIFVGAFLTNITTAGSVATSLGIAIGNTLEGWLGSILIQRWARGRHAFARPSDIFKFTLAAALSATLSASIGVTTLALAGLAAWNRYGAIWLTWWLGDTVGDLVVTPLLFLWITSPWKRWPRQRLPEAIAFAATLFLLGWVIFGKHFPLAFAIMPVVVWAAFRFGAREAITATTLVAVMAIPGSMQGWGPFTRVWPHEALLLWQAYVGTLAVMGLTVSAVVEERQQAQQALRRALDSSEARFRRLMESNLIGIYLADPRGRIWEANDAFLKMVGFSREDLPQGLLNLASITPPQFLAQDMWALEQVIVNGQCPPLEKELLRRDGRRIPVVVGSVGLEEGSDRTVSFVIDASARRQAMEALRKAYDEIETRVEERTQELQRVNIELQHEVALRVKAENQLREISLRDPLTDLYNRRGFMALAEQQWQQAVRDHKAFLVFFLDVDGLKPINDGLGHLQGDQALVETAEALRHVFRKSDILARIGGDEFAVVAVDAQTGHIATYKTRLEAYLKDVNASGRLPFRLSMSLGVASFDAQTTTTVQELMNQADEDLYKHKHQALKSVTP